MLIYGTKTKALVQKKLAESYGHCNSSHTVNLTVSQKYVHFFWIPLFPIGKTAESTCSHCKQHLRHNEFSGSLLKEFENVKLQTKTPKWTFSGLLLLAVLVAISITVQRMNHAKNAKLILEPKKGDIYEIKLDFRQYTLYKVQRVSNDSVYYLVSTYEATKTSKLDEIKKLGKKAYLDFPIGMTKKELKSMFDQGDLLDIDRN